MRPAHRWYALAAATAVLVAAGCTASGGSSPAASVLGATAAPPTMAESAASSASSMASGAAGALTIGQATSAKLGQYLTGTNGLALYVFKNDAPDKSNCSGACATNWPPVTVPGGSFAPPSGMSGFGTITRADGSTQLTYNHQPLYYFKGDSKAGDTNGQGIGGVWSVATLMGSGGAGGASSAPTSPGGSGGYTSY